MPTTTQDYLTTALRELGIVDVTDASPDPSLSNLALGLLNRILDDWNAERGAVYADVFAPLLALTGGLNPHTIGPTGATWAVTVNRPVSIEGIRLTPDNGLTFLAPMNKRDAAWWHALAVPGTSSTYPTDFFYDPTWPNGSIFFYPKPSSSAIKAELWYRIVLAQLALFDVVTLPPGYQSAITETLKERLTELPMFKSLASEDIKAAARTARGVAFSNNTPVPVLYTEDSGISTGCGRGDYLWLTGPYSLMSGSS